MSKSTDLLAAARQWQRAALAHGQMLATANIVIRKRCLEMALGTMKHEEAARMVLEKPAAFAKAAEMAARARAARRGHAAVALAAIQPLGARTRANALRLTKAPRRKG